MANKCNICDQGFKMYEEYRKHMDNHYRLYGNRLKKSYHSMKPGKNNRAPASVTPVIKLPASTRPKRHQAKLSKEEASTEGSGSVAPGEVAVAVAPGEGEVAVAVAKITLEE